MSKLYESINDELQEPEVEENEITFVSIEDAIHYLIDDENEAIEGYNKVLEQLDELNITDDEKEKFREQLNHILEEEREHIHELKVLIGEEEEDVDSEEIPEE